jgi:hypothetical protein
MAIEGAEIVKAAAFIGAGISMGLGAMVRASVKAWWQQKHARRSEETPRKPAF